MIGYIFDGTKNGLFTCIFEAFYEKRYPDVLTDSFLEPRFGDTVYEITTDLEKATRVKKCLTDTVKTPYVLKDITLALKSGQTNKYTVIFNYLKTVIDNKGIDVSKNFANPAVLEFSDLLKKITNEIHRFKGFIRFEEAKDGFYYAHFSPDNDITWLLMSHFSARFSNEAFIIHDTKRNVLGLYDGTTSKEISAENKQVTVYLSNEELNFKKLWKTYYDSVNVKERKNRRLQTAFMPKRYWINLPETQVEFANF
ncbi:MAG: DNA metabolism protein [Clostridiales bacterium]|nr:DNA metabolism protein [Clostridiales bacterium]